MKETCSIYNTEPLLNEVELVIKNGLDKILAKTLQRYELLERTHKQLMKLPSIREELNNDNDSCSDSDSDSDSSDSDTKLNAQKQRSNQEDNFVNKDDLFNVYYKINNLETKYLNLNGLMDKLIDKIEILNNKIDKMAREPKPIANISIKPSVESSIVSACKNENIKVDIDSDIEDLDDSSLNVKPTNLPIIVKKIEADEVVEDEESVEEEKEKSVDEAVEEEEEEEEAVEEEEEEEKKESVEEVVEEEESVEEVVEEEEEEKEEEEEEEEEEANEVEKDNDDNSVETETKEDAASEAEEEEEELFEIDIDDITYCTNNEENGSIYELKDGDVGDKVGYFKEGEPIFYADEN
jgi:outer membrane biosynthesis protein TonB